MCEKINIHLLTLLSIKSFKILIQSVRFAETIARVQIDRIVYVAWNYSNKTKFLQLLYELYGKNDAFQKINLKTEKGQKAYTATK